MRVLKASSKGLLSNHSTKLSFQLNKCKRAQTKTVFWFGLKYVQNMQNTIEQNTYSEPAIVGVINEFEELSWRYSERLLKFIDSLPESRRYPLVNRIGHEIADELALLVINRQDLKKTNWHKLEDYL